jgi:hypothetical protein
MSRGRDTARRVAIIVVAIAAGFATLALLVSVFDTR